VESTKLRVISDSARIASLHLVLVLGLMTIPSAAQSSGPTFSKEVAPILFKRCVSCHRPNEIAGIASFVSYASVRPWAKAIKTKVLRREMPPWPADPRGSVKFRNDVRLSQHEIDTLVAWVDAGAPKGNPSDLPPTPQYAVGWRHPNGLPPDLILALPAEVRLPAKGEIPYVRSLAKVPVLDDKWIAAIQIRPGNRSVVHHLAITEVALDDGVRATDLNAIARLAKQLGIPNGFLGIRPAVTAPTNPSTFDMLGMYVPGTNLEMYAAETAKLLHGGSNLYLSFNVHYQTTGKPETDQSAIALWFQPGPPKHQLFRMPASGGTIISEGRELLTDAPGVKAEGTSVTIPPIPPYADNYELIAVTAYTEPVTIYQFQPHAHLRGKDFQYAVVFPDGRNEPVLSVPRYDFNWQIAYELETPLKLPAGSKLVVTAHYDNSIKNLANPGPDKTVYFREENQSWDEMFSPLLEYSVDRQDLTKNLPKRPDAPDSNATGKRTEQNKENTVDIVEIVGCLAQRPSNLWMLTNASAPAVTSNQASSLTALKEAAAIPLGDLQYRILGIDVFNPSRHSGQKVALKGALIRDINEDRLNVTSVQMLATSCVN